MPLRETKLGHSLILKEPCNIAGQFFKSDINKCVNVKLPPTSSGSPLNDCNLKQSTTAKLPAAISKFMYSGSSTSSQLLIVQFANPYHSPSFLNLPTRIVLSGCIINSLSLRSV